ncbi:MAG: SpoIIE family protein phosphatase [Clostridia bacterium]|nr:SpoIIE family protein phosphatase [Clostridia bacterium]
MKALQMLKSKSVHTVFGQLALLCLCFAAGIIFSQTALFSFAPIGIAFISSVPVFAVLPACLGSMVGSILGIGEISVAKYLLSAALAAVCRFGFSFFKKQDSYISPLCSFVVIVVSSFLTQLYSGFAATLLVLSLFEGLFCAALTYFFYSAISSLSISSNSACLDFRQITAVVVTVSVWVACLSSFTLFDISIARIIAVTLILSASQGGHEQAGAISGISFGAALALANPDTLFLCGGYAMGGLFAGTFSRMNTLLSAVAFAVSNGLFALLSGDKNIAVITCYEVLFASVLFLVLPIGVKKQFSLFFAPKLVSPDIVNPQRLLSTRLNKAGKALDETADMISKVGDILAGSSTELETVFETVRVTVCRGCALCNYCWESQKAETLSEFISATKHMRQNNDEIFSEEFISRCTRQNKVERGLCSAFYDYISQEKTRQHVCDVQTAVKMQFQSVSALLSQLSFEVSQTDGFDKSTADMAEAVFKELQLHPKEITARIDKNGRLTIDATLTDKVIPQKKIAERLSLCCDRELETVELTRCDSLTYITLSDKAVYTVDFAARQHTNSGYSVCGDAYNKINNGRGVFSMLISDGMGSGTRAAVEGTMAVGLMSRLIRAGFDCPSAVGLVNSALMFKSGDETLATLDISAIDLYSGKVSFFKAGTPPTFIRNEGRIGTAGCSAMPIGILPEIQFEQSECTLSRGDIIVMVSDGATDNGIDWIKSEIKHFEGSAATLADRLIKTSVERFCGHEDDVTVLVAIIK